jgi:outer membrane protein
MDLFWYQYIEKRRYYVKRSICLIAMITILIFVWNADLRAENKIGFINMKEILRSSSTGQKAIKNLKKLSEQEEKLIKSSEKELQKMKEELEEKGAKMTTSVRNEKVYAYKKKLREYELQVNDVGEDLKRQDQETVQKMLPEIMKIVQSIAEKEKYTMILDVATMAFPYYDRKYDISEKVIKEFNKTK